MHSSEVYNLATLWTLDQVSSTCNVFPWKWVLNPIRKRLVTPVTFLQKWLHQWAHLSRIVIIVAPRVHSLVRPLMAFLLRTLQSILEHFGD